MTKLFSRGVLAAAVVAGSSIVAFGTANAAPLPGPATVPAQIAETGQDAIVEKAQYYGRPWWRHRHHRPHIYFSFGPRRHYGYWGHRRPYW